MSTWQIFSEAGNAFQWKISDQQLRINPYEDPVDALAPHGSCNRLPSMVDILRQECPKLSDDGNGNADRAPMFRTALGKSVFVKQSSISKAFSILGDEADAVATGELGGRGNGCDVPNTMYQTVSGKVINVENSMFQTGSGKAIHISSAGLVRAKTLFGFEENFNDETFKVSRWRSKQPTADEHLDWKSSSDLKRTKGLINVGYKGATSMPIDPFNFNSTSIGNELKEVAPDLLCAASKPPPIKFRTASGRVISVSADALHRARSLLGDPELGTSLVEGDANHPVNLFLEDRESDDKYLGKENNPYPPSIGQAKAESKDASKNFVSPSQPAFNKKHLDSKRTIGEKKGFGRSYISPFKRPRASVFTPL